MMQTFQVPQFKNPLSNPESNKTVVMKLHHSCIFKLYVNSVVHRNRMVGSKDFYAGITLQQVHL